MTLASGAVKADDFAGIYVARRAGYDWSMTITPRDAGSYKVTASVSASRPHCVGDLETTGKLQGDSLVTEPPVKGEECILVIARTRRGIRVREKSCSAWHGAACTFSAELDRR
jgi:hypothetical protein